MKAYAEKTALLIILAGMCANVFGREYEQNKLHIGGGMAFNNFAAGNSAGYQWFAGYDLSQFVSLGRRVTFVPELGFTSSGKAISKTSPALNGIWATAVVGYDITENMKYINRLGVDFGDAFGLMMGVGFEYAIDEHITTRSEVVMRGEFKSYQVNVLYRF